MGTPSSSSAARMDLKEKGLGEGRDTKQGSPGCGLIPGNGNTLSCDEHRIMAGKLLAC